MLVVSIYGIYRDFPIYKKLGKSGQSVYTSVASNAWNKETELIKNDIDVMCFLISKYKTAHYYPIELQKEAE